MPTTPTKIATFNVNNVNARLGHLLRWLKESKPDVVCLQELKTVHDSFPSRAIKEAGYDSVWKGQKSWNGVAILSRCGPPVVTRTSLPGDPADDQSRYIEAAVGGILVGCIYLPNGNPQPGPKFDYKLAWFERLIKHAATLAKSKAPVILAGDYNVVPTDADIYNPKSWKRDALLQPAPRAAYQRLLTQGWTDALKAIHGDEQVFTFWDYFRNHWERNAGLRIDHILLNKALAKRLKDANVDREVRGWTKPSDHAPVWITLKAATSAAKTPKSKARSSARSAQSKARPASRSR